LLWLAAVPVAGLTLALPPSAHAATTDPNDPTAGWAGVAADGTLTFYAGIASLENHITISPAPNGAVRIVDDNYPIFAIQDCIMWSDHEAECGRSSTITGLFVDTHQSDDTIINLIPTKNLIHAKLYGGSGNDVIYGGPGSQQVFGGLSPDDLRNNRGVPENGNDQLFGGCPVSCADGNDNLWGSDGNDSLNGGPGNDTLQGGFGVDTYVGGSGDGDAVSYADHGDSVNVSLDDVANDGRAGELENVPSDVENLYGGGGFDVLVGNFGRNALYGGASGDRLDGLEGSDWLEGGSGNDAIYGGQDDDIMFGGTGDDTLIGGLGFDKAREYVGEGNDTCQAAIHDNCERVLP
jgi:Ca2+-binding RTX toxin-like protein